MAELRLTDIADRTRMSLRYWQRQAALGVIPGTRVLASGRRKEYFFDEAAFVPWWEAQLRPVPYQPPAYNGAAELVRLRRRQPYLLSLTKHLRGWVYFVNSDDRVKIGYSAAPRLRLSNLRTDSPNRVYLVGLIRGDMEYETELHQQFWSARVHGDWFRPIKQLVDFIEQEAGHG